MFAGGTKQTEQATGLIRWMQRLLLLVNNETQAMSAELLLLLV
jgi:hypothetical protein